jgi:flagellar protein FlgJ
MNRIDSQGALAADASAEATPIAPALDTTAPDADAAFRAKATAAAEKFESFFIAQMLKQMRATTAQFADEGSVFKDPVNQDMQGLADGLMSDQMSGRHAFGIADAILRQLLPAAPAANSQVSLLPGALPLNTAPPAVASDKR